MQLLCLSDADPVEVLPGLELLTHEIRSAPLGVKVLTSVAERFDALVIDGTREPRLAKAACLALNGMARTPRLLVVSDAVMPAVSAEWGVADVLLPTASPAEIELRLRRATEAAEATAHLEAPTELSAAGVVIDEGNFTARIHGRTLDLTYKEFELLHFLTAHAGRVFTREQLLDDVWGSDYFGGVRTVDVHVRRLRAKLGDHDSLICTVRGVGYGFARPRVDVEEAT